MKNKWDVSYSRWEISCKGWDNGVEGFKLIPKARLIDEK
jgi:hypothetical protein